MIKVCVGGTFDILHTGHHHLLQKALDSGDHLTIGLTTDEYANQKRNRVVNSFQIRRKNLEIWLEKHISLENINIVPLSEEWGPPALSSSFHIIVVTPDSQSVAIRLNQHRKELDMPELKIIVVSLVLDSEGVPVSSTRLHSSDTSKKNNQKANP